MRSGFDRLSFRSDLSNGGLNNAHLHAFGQLNFQFVVIFDLYNLTDQATLGHNLVTATQRRHHCLVILDLLLLRPDQQEVHDHEDQNKRDKLAKSFHRFVLCLAGPPPRILQEPMCHCPYMQGEKATCRSLTGRHRTPVQKSCRLHAYDPLENAP